MADEWKPGGWLKLESVLHACGAATDHVKTDTQCAAIWGAVGSSQQTLALLEAVAALDVEPCPDARFLDTDVDLVSLLLAAISDPSDPN